MNASRAFGVTLLIFILLLGIFFRFWHITETPPGLFPDEAMNGNNAAELLETGAPKVFYTENNGREGLYVWLQAASIYIFGHEAWALRLVSAIIGTLTILTIYFLAKEMFWYVGNRYSTIIALLSAFFLATSFWHIMFSRIGFRAILVPLISSLALYFLLNSFRTGYQFKMVLAGLFTGLGLYTYISFRFMPFVLLIPIFWYLWQWWKKKSASPGCAPCLTVLFLFFSLVVFIPLGLYFFEHPEDILGRSGQVSIFSAENPILEFAKSNGATLAMLFIFGDCNMRHNYACFPELNPLVAISLAVGLWVIVKNSFQKPKQGSSERMHSILLFFWLVLMSLPTTLTREGLPHALRSIGMIPPIILISALGAHRAYLFFSKRFSKRATVAVSLVSGIAIIFSVYSTYFSLWAHDEVTKNSFSADVHAMSKDIVNRPLEEKKIVVTELPWPDLRPVGTPAQTIMFITDSFTENARKEKYIEYVADQDTEDRIRKILGVKEKFSLFILNSPRNKELIVKLLSTFENLKIIKSGEFTVLSN